jgi:hypothetical protein
MKRTYENTNAQKEDDIVEEAATTEGDADLVAEDDGFWYFYRVFKAKRGVAVNGKLVQLLPLHNFCAHTIARFCENFCANLVSTSHWGIIFSLYTKVLHKKIKMQRLKNSTCSLYHAGLDYVKNFIFFILLGHLF